MRLTRYALTVLLTWTAMTTMAHAHGDHTGPRHEVNFNADWKFQLGQKSTEPSDPAFDDSGWRELDLPHDYSVEQEASPDEAAGTGFRPGGWGFYRKSFELSEDWDGKRVFVRFDGVMRHSTVWINGHKLGHRPNGYIGFRYELTDHLNADGPNVIAVQCERENVADSRWYTGTGIYRHVWLEAVEPIHIAEHGVFVTTPTVSDAQAEVKIEYEVVNSTDKWASLRVVSTILDPSGEVVAKGSLGIDRIKGTASPKTLLKVENPSLWSPDSPALYTLVTGVYDGLKLVDVVETTFGIRTFRFDPKTGFYLNGENIFLKGMCIHHDVAAVGAAVPDAMWERRLRLLKSIGVNAIRMSHNPMAPELYEMCDRLGFLVQDEAFDEWIIGKRKWRVAWNKGEAKTYGYSNDFEEWSERDARDLVRMNRNHPSIIMWSIGNEIDFPTDPTVHPQGRYGFDPNKDQPRAELLVPHAERLIKAVKEEDPTRPVTMALADINASNATGLADMLDVVGYNYLEQHYDDHHEKYPNRIMYGSENGLTERLWRIARDRPYISSQFLWNAFAYLGEARDYPSRGWLGGVYDFSGFPNPAAHMRKVFWSPEPSVWAAVVPIGDDQNQQAMAWNLSGFTEHWTLGAPEGETVRVRAYINTDEAELFLNGESYGTKSPRDGAYRVTWDLPYEPGTVKVLGRNADGTTAEWHLTTYGEPVQVKLVVEEAATGIGSTPIDIAHVQVHIVDAAGNRVQDYKGEVTVSVNGTGKLLALDNGDTHNMTSTLDDTHAIHEGRALAYVQPTGAGTITITATADGLATGTATVQAWGH